MLDRFFCIGVQNYQMKYVCLNIIMFLVLLFLIFTNSVPLITERQIYSSFRNKITLRTIEDRRFKIIVDEMKV